MLELESGDDDWGDFYMAIEHFRSDVYLVEYEKSANVDPSIDIINEEFARK